MRRCKLTPVSASTDNEVWLERLGIERYRLRVAEGVETAPPTAASIDSVEADASPATPTVSSSRAGAGSPGSATGLAALRASLTDAPAAQPEATLATEQEAPRADGSNSGDRASASRDVEALPTQPEPQQPSEPIDLLCVVHPDVFLVVPATQSSDTLRLLDDLVLAVTGGERSDRLSFRWPDPTLPNAAPGTADTATGGRAWQAFYSRRAAQAKAKLAVDTPLMRSLLDDDDAVWLPPLDQVVGSADAKRALWNMLRDAL